MRLLAAALAAALTAGHAFADLKGHYVEARTCDIWTGPCYSNSEVNIAGKHAVLAWKVEAGSFGGVKLDGLAVVAVVTARDTLGLPQTGEASAVVLVDARATDEQKAALLRLARLQGGELTANVTKVKAEKIDMDLCPCKENGCASLIAGAAKVETRCLSHKHDSICGHESPLYEPLTKNVKVTAAMAVEHSYSGDGAGAKWSDAGRRGAYVGTFSVR
jgi:hypothetical protein